MYLKTIFGRQFKIYAFFHVHLHAWVIFFDIPMFFPLADPLEHRWRVDSYFAWLCRRHKSSYAMPPSRKRLSALPVLQFKQLWAETAKKHLKMRGNRKNRRKTVPRAISPVIDLQGGNITQRNAVQRTPRNSQEDCRRTLRMRNISWSG